MLIKEIYRQVKSQTPLQIVKRHKTIIWHFFIYIFFRKMTIMSLMRVVLIILYNTNRSFHI